MGHRLPSVRGRRIADPEPHDGAAEVDLDGDATAQRRAATGDLLHLGGPGAGPVGALVRRRDLRVDVAVTVRPRGPHHGANPNHGRGGPAPGRPID